jgi:hypothetical protein
MKSLRSYRRLPAVLWGLLLAGCSASTEATDARAPQPVTERVTTAPVPSTSAPAFEHTSAASVQASTSSDAPLAAAPLPKGTAVLHVGDSFVYSGLAQRLRERLEGLGVRYQVHAKESTNSLDWAKRVPDLVAATKPDLVIITLGGNEIGSKHLDVQARAVERIVKAIDGRPCVWTTPPLWMEESGLFDAIQAHVAPCRFFETDVILGKFIPRRADKIHPTAEGGAMWADALFDWLMAERNAPVAVEGKAWSLKPASDKERSPRGKRGPLAP